MAPVSRAAWLRGGAAPRPPRPPRAPRPPPAAGGVAGGGGGAASAASSGARSASVDHRNNSIVSAVSEDAPMTAARRCNAGSSASAAARPAPTITPTAMAATATRRQPLLAITVVGPFRTAEPLHESFELRVLQPGPALAHVQRHYAPAFGAEARRVDTIDRVAGRACPLQQALALGVGEEGRDLLRHVGARKGLARRAEPLRQPVEQNGALFFRKRHIHAAMLGCEMKVPCRAVERVVGV